MQYNNLTQNPFDRAVSTYPYVWWDGIFKDKELDLISDYCEEQGLQRGLTFNKKENKLDESVNRKSDINFIRFSEETSWIFERLNYFLTKINSEYYGFNLNGYDSFQYTTYNSNEKGHYGWHVDMNFGGQKKNTEFFHPRKLSLSLLLNDPVEDFDGGELQICLGDQKTPESLELKKGRAIVFPSFIPHRVTKVTRGVRKSLVVWVVGPKFT